MPLKKLQFQFKKLSNINDKSLVESSRSNVYSKYHNTAKDVNSDLNALLSN